MCSEIRNCSCGAAVLMLVIDGSLDGVQNLHNMAKIKCCEYSMNRELKSLQVDTKSDNKM